MARIDQLDADRALLLVVDVQTKLLPLVHHAGVVRANLLKLLEGSRPFELPVLVTEQYPKGLGPTESEVAALLSACDAVVVEKPTFSAWDHPPVRRHLLRQDRPQVILAGVETHVCILQTALDLAVRDYDVFVCADAVSARGSIDHQQALHRMRDAGLRVTTVESVLFELCGRCDAPRFKPMIEVIKRRPPHDAPSLQPPRDPRA